MHRQQPPAQIVAAPNPDILLVEDEVPFARAIAKRLRRSGYECRLAETLDQARACLRERVPDMVLLDMRLPDGSGIDLLAELRERHGTDLPILVMTAYGDLDDAVQAMKLSAMDYLKKPIDLDELLLNVEKLRLRGAERRSVASARSREAARSEVVGWIGVGSSSQAVLEQVARIGAIAAATTEVPPSVLLSGETGTGKDLVARLLHQARGDLERPFVQVDCAALPPHLVESELFGHERGAFTSATQSRLGLFEAAEDGTLFIDEVGELSLELQTKLLAVLERRSLRRVGGNREYPVNAWILVATNRDLRQLVDQGRFRADLYYRLRVLDLDLPPLRQRGEDVAALLSHFMGLTARRYGVELPELSATQWAALGAYQWPGNVRELKHWVERAVLLKRTEVDVDPDREPESTRAAITDMTLEAAERNLIERALDRHRGNVSRAARMLGVTRMALRYRMDKHGIQRPSSD